MIVAEELLKPISDGAPCGEDLYYDPGFQELETLIKGKPETQFSKAEEPDWKKLQQRCLELWERSKDLRLATALCLSVTKMEGLPSVREGFALIKGLLERYWEPVYPRLDPEDGNDPLMRINIISALATPKATYGDPMKFIDRLHETPLCSSMQLGRFGYTQIARAQSGEPPVEGGEGAITAAQVEGAFKDTDPETLNGNYKAVTESIQLVNEMDSLLTNLVGSGAAPSLDPLVTALKDMQKAMAPYVSQAAAEVAGEAGTATADGSSASGAAGAPRQGISGEIQSRDDVLRMLDKICDYYQRSEPASPVPALVRRAQRLAVMNFMDVIKDLCPDAETAVRTITGERAES